MPQVIDGAPLKIPSKEQGPCKNVIAESMY